VRLGEIAEGDMREVTDEVEMPYHGEPRRGRR
jgi:hypothetical protein